VMHTSYNKLYAVACNASGESTTSSMYGLLKHKSQVCHTYAFKRIEDTIRLTVCRLLYGALAACDTERVLLLCRTTIMPPGSNGTYI
jgi:hypothetical protein